MRFLKTKEFARFARKQKIGDDGLCEAVDRAGDGLIDADLGGGLIKQRIARAGQGRSGGFRTIIAFRSGERSVFLYGFAKSGKADLSEKELAIYKRLAGVFLSLQDSAVVELVGSRELIEVICNGD